jgi:hypothetical protein
VRSACDSERPTTVTHGQSWSLDGDRHESAQSAFTLVSALEISPKLVVRGRVELPTFRFSGEIWPSRAVAGRRLISHLTCTTVVGRRLASLGVCLRWPPLWLPVWLPSDSLNREAESHQRRVIGYIFIAPPIVSSGRFHR